MAEDVRYILDIKKPEKKEPKTKEIKKKPEGVHRELFALLGKEAAPLVAVDKDYKAVKIDKVSKWVWSGFENSARSDSLVLNHWQKESDQNTAYPFSKLNKSIEIQKFNDEEFEKHIKDIDPLWSKEETFYLWELLELYDLRFIVVQDRYSDKYSRSVEEIKERYYSVAKKLLETRNDNNHNLVRRPYNYDYDVRRKHNLEKFLLRSKEQHEKERSLLEEAKKLEQKIKKEEKEERNLKKLINSDLIDNQISEPSLLLTRRKNSKNMSVNTTSAPKAVTENLSPLLSPSQGGRGGRRDRGSGVYLRSQRISAPLPISERLNKKMEIALNELGIPPKLTPTATIVNQFDQLRKEILKLFSLQKHVEKKENEKKQLEERMKELEIKKKIEHPSGHQIPSEPPNQARKPINQTTSLSATTVNSVNLQNAPLVGNATNFKKTLGTINTVYNSAAQSESIESPQGSSTPEKKVGRKNADKKGKRKHGLGTSSHAPPSKRQKKS